MANFPQPIKQREDLNLRLGIKSSLSQLRSIVASLYVIYKANDKQSCIAFSKETQANGLVYIKLDDDLSQKINLLYGESFIQLVEKSPLFTSQLEALQVGVELFFHLGKIDFVNSGISERTGSNRYQKKIAFSTNIILVDLYLASHPVEDVNKLLSAWLKDEPFSSNLENGLRLMLNTFTEETQFKIRDENAEEIVFNQEGVYAELLASKAVSSNDAKEPVGPFRVYKSYLSAGMHPFIVERKQSILLQDGIDEKEVKCYSEMVDTSLSLCPKRTIVIQEQIPERSYASNNPLLQSDDPTTFVWETLKFLNRTGELQSLFTSKYRGIGGSIGNYITINGCYVAQTGKLEDEYFENVQIYDGSYINNGFDARDIELFVEAVNDIYTNKYCAKIIQGVDGESYLLTELHTQIDVKSEYTPYLTALRTKPFMLLAGISGTGKSRIAREIAKACWPIGHEQRSKQVPDNFCMVQVKPNWHDSTELLGYVSRIGEKPHYITGDFLPFIAQAWENPTIPYIFCLDEMNLAPVEQYFAEYLSVIESRKSTEGVITTDPIIKKNKDDWYRVLTAELTSDDNLRNKFLNEGITIPKNLFVIGTVNMDETTFSFSRKVLDRAMTIEMNTVDLYSSLSEKPEGDLGYISNILLSKAAKGTDVYLNNKVVCDKVVEYLEKVNRILDGTPFKIAYRTRNEFMLYAITRPNIEAESPLWKSLDEMTSMKILSRIEGDEERCKVVLNKLNALLNDEFADHMDESVSIKKVDEMIKKLSVGYTSYWT